MTNPPDDDDPWRSWRDEQRSVWDTLNLIAWIVIGVLLVAAVLLA